MRQNASDDLSVFEEVQSFYISLVNRSYNTGHPVFVYTAVWDKSGKLMREGMDSDILGRHQKISFCYE